MEKRVLKGKYTVPHQADAIDVFLDIETYLAKEFECIFGKQYNLEYLVNIKNSAMMVIANQQIIFVIRMAECEKIQNSRELEHEIYKYTIELAIHQNDYDAFLNIGIRLLSEIS